MSYQNRHDVTAAAMRQIKRSRMDTYAKAMLEDDDVADELLERLMRPPCIIEQRNAEDDAGSVMADNDHDGLG